MRPKTSFHCVVLVQKWLQTEQELDRLCFMARLKFVAPDFPVCAWRAFTKAPEPILWLKLNFPWYGGKAVYLFLPLEVQGFSLYMTRNKSAQQQQMTTPVLASQLYFCRTPEMRCLAWCTWTTSPSSPCLLAGGSSPGASPWTLAEILSVRSAGLLPFPFDTAGVSPNTSSLRSPPAELDGGAGDGSALPQVSVRRPRADLRDRSPVTPGGHPQSLPGGRGWGDLPSPRSLQGWEQRGARPDPLPSAGGQLLGSGAYGVAVVSALQNAL